ncbi:interleukin-32 [Neomonachus schauinslandi]|uniref:Interleukin-32 n=1 Tax=Neomonachus schauinslandi TaxID=29088 RepID=A0A2Y9HWT7_NEOSC|nr:interleukin-32 [Neomonachus schauinslandi]XP_044770991.1 interleukin-32 [Neomonachus schauinslandi]
MCFTQVSTEGRSLTEILQLRMHQMVDSFFNNHRHQPEGQEQEQVALLQLEDDFDEALLDAAMDLHYQNSNQDSSPLLPEVRQELRSRVRRSSVLSLEDQSPEGCSPKESFCKRALRSFQRLLCCLWQKWQAALAWLKKTLSAGVQALCRAVEAIWSVFNDFCSFMAQVIRSATQA